MMIVEYVRNPEFFAIIDYGDNDQHGVVGKVERAVSAHRIYSFRANVCLLTGEECSNLQQS